MNALSSVTGDPRVDTHPLGVNYVENFAVSLLIIQPHVLIKKNPMVINMLMSLQQ